jgi:hypothetical protein
LQTIVYRGVQKSTSPLHLAFAIDGKFFRDVCCYGDDNFYISSSVFQEPGTKQKAWGVEFNYGKDFIGHMRDKHRFRAVREVYRAAQIKEKQLTLF